MPCFEEAHSKEVIKYASASVHARAFLSPKTGDEMHDAQPRGLNAFVNVVTAFQNARHEVPETEAVEGHLLAETVHREQKGRSSFRARTQQKQQKRQKQQRLLVALKTASTKFNT